MPQHKSPKKQLRVDAKRNERNRARRSTLSRAIREFRGLPDAEAKKAELPAIVSKLDRAARTGLIHRNASARLKSRLSRGLGS